MNLLHDPFTTGMLILGVTFLALAVIIWLRRYNEPRSAGWLVAYAALGMLWSLAQIAAWNNWFPGLTEDFRWRWPLYGLICLAVLFYEVVLALALPSGRKPGWLGIWLAGLAWLAVLGALEANWAAAPPALWSGPGWLVTRRGFFLAAITLGWALFTGVAAFVILGAYRRTVQPVFRNRLKYLAPVFLLQVVGAAVFLLRYWFIGSALHLAGAALAAYVVLHARLPSLGRTVLGMLSYVVALLLTAGAYLVGILGGMALARRWALAPDWVWAGGLALVLAAAANPLLLRAQNWLDRRIAGERRDAQQLIRQYSQGISNILDVRLLARIALELIGEAVEAQSVRLFLVDREKDDTGENGYRLRAVLADGQAPVEDCYLPGASPLAQTLRAGQRVLLQVEIEQAPRFRTLGEPESCWLAGLGLEAYVPVYAKDEWIGLFGLGPKTSGAPYLEEDLDLLRTLADQTAVALENARLVESLLRLNNEFRQAYQALERANRKLESLDKTKSDFISRASHELRTPLTLVIGYSQMLLEEQEVRGDPAVAKMLDGIHSGVLRLREIVDSLLDMAKVEMRTVELDPQRVSLVELVEGLHAELEGALRDRQQRLEIVSLNNLPLLEVDRSAVQKVFHHLLTNAIKYTPDGGRITVSGQVLPPAQGDLSQGGVEVMVCDTGIGVDPQVHELIFNKFYQTGELALHSTGQTKFKGAGPGLGLAIAKGIVEAHGGRLWVESPGYDEKTCPGSCFHVVLPMRVRISRPVGNPLLNL